MLDDVKREEFQSLIKVYAEKALRTISCALKAVPVGGSRPSDDSDLVFAGMFGIMDPLRPEVIDAVIRCQRAGIVVRMVTGDSADTAQAISRECGILSSDGIIMEGPEFRKLSETEMDHVLPKLQVLARSSPLDKQILVKNLKRLGETVAVTGDGTNDAPALTNSDVGFAMVCQWV